MLDWLIDFDGIIESMLSVFTNAGGDRLRDGLDVIFAGPVPDFTLEWFTAMYSLVFGLAAIIALPIAVVQILLGLLPSGDLANFNRAWKTIVYTFVGGMFLPLVLSILVGVSDAVTNATLVLTGEDDGLDTLELFFSSFGASGGMMGIDQLLIASLSWIFILLLGVSAAIASLSAYVSLVFGALSLPMRYAGRFGEVFGRWAIGIAFIALLSRPLMAFFLATAVWIFNTAENIVPTAAFFTGFLKLGVLLWTALIPLVLFVIYQTKLSRVVGGYISVGGDVSTSSNRSSMMAKAAFATAAGVHYLNMNSERLGADARSLQRSGPDRLRKVSTLSGGVATKMLAKSHPVIAVGAETTSMATRVAAKRSEKRHQVREQIHQAREQRRVEATPPLPPPLPPPPSRPKERPTDV